MASSQDAALQLWNEQVLNLPNGCTCISMIKKKGITVAPPHKHNVTIMPTPSPRQYVEEYWLREGVLSVTTYTPMPDTSY